MTMGSRKNDPEGVSTVNMICRSERIMVLASALACACTPDSVKAEAHRLAHKLRDPKFYTARTKRAVNSGGVL